ncbi:MAG TPA: alpha/beta hydrolase-fold protein [Longimicrobiales bacterium]|nr:alpha/beta hydrolase-fold protein [Longimicrobiales bacterium]
MSDLEYILHVPEGARDGAPLIVLLHGRGANEADLQPLASKLPAGAIATFPRAPFPAAPWGYGPGWAWYRFLGRDRPEPESFSASLDALEAFLDSLPGKLPVRPGPLVLGGFSQGGTLSMAFALTRPGRVPLVLNFSGFLANHPAVAATPDTVRGTRFFWGHGTRDPNIPFELAVEGRERLHSAGADLEARDYPIGHWIDPLELRHAVEWVERHVADQNRTAP